jgi:hypothetical protein
MLKIQPIDVGLLVFPNVLVWEFWEIASKSGNGRRTSFWVEEQFSHTARAKLFLVCDGFEPDSCFNIEMISISTQLTVRKLSI